MAAAAPAAAPADLQRRAKQLGVELEPLHKNFGVQVKGLDLTRPLSEEQQAFLLEMWRVHDLLLFRGQELSPADEQRALLYFPHDAQAIEEERFCAPFFNVRVPSHPLFAVGGGGIGWHECHGIPREQLQKRIFQGILLAVRGGGIDVDEHHGIPREDLQMLNFQGGVYRRSRVWHMDASHDRAPPEASSLHMILVPEAGGETVFASTAKAFENLDEETKQLVLGLDTVNACGSDVVGTLDVATDGSRRLDDIYTSIEMAKQKGMYNEPPPVPLVIKDPKTGRRSMLFSVNRVHAFRSAADPSQQMSRADSQDLLERLLKAATADSEVLSLTWQPGDFAVWANRRIVHSTTPEADYEHATRMFHLVFLDADTPLVAGRD